MAVKIRRIEKEFTFKTLISNFTSLKIHHHGKELICRLLRYNEEQLEVEVDRKDIHLLKKGDDIRVYFIFQNNRHTFHTVIKKIKQNLIFLKQPDGLFKNLQREYERVQPEGAVNINFKLKEKRVELNFPRTANYYSLNEFDLPLEQDMSNVSKLIQGFRDKLKYEVSENHIIMLRNKVPTTYEEKIMAKSGKIMWFPSIEEGLMNERVLPEDILYKEDELYLYEEENGLNIQQIREKLERIKQNKLNRGYYSQLYCPILYNEYFIGYIYVLNTLSRKFKLDIEIVKMVYEFSRVLCYSLKINNYFKARAKEESSYEVPIIDISASGLLFAHSEKRLPKELLLHTPIELVICINNRKLNISARVMRKFHDLRFCYFGLQFTSIKPEDFRFLFEYIYGKEYIQEADTLWKEIEGYK